MKKNYINPQIAIDSIAMTGCLLQSPQMQGSTDTNTSTDHGFGGGGNGAPRRRPF